MDSQAWADAFNEVKTLGSATDSTRTADQTQIARFWADGAGTHTPTGHWNQIAAQLATTAGNSLSANARLFAQLNVVLADAAIIAWDAKYGVDFWRPITANRAGDTDGTDRTAKDETWTSFLITPPFPEYVSGHSSFSGAAAEVLSDVFGDRLGFTTSSYGLPGVQRTFTSFQQAAEEASFSRILGGIPYEFSGQDGIEAGRALANAVLSRFDVTGDVVAPTILVEQPESGLVAPANLNVQGRLLGRVCKLKRAWKR